VKQPPFGNDLVTAKVTIGKAEGWRYCQRDFDLQLALFPQSYWLLVATARGAGFWLGRQEAAALFSCCRRRQTTAVFFQRADRHPARPSVFRPTHDMKPENQMFDLKLNGAMLAASSVSEDTFKFADGALKDFIYAEFEASPAPDATEDHHRPVFQRCLGKWRRKLRQVQKH